MVSNSISVLQAKFLSPDEVKVKELVNVLTEKKIGVLHTSTWTLKSKVF